MPKRGAIALGLTTLALVLLLNFQTPGTIATQKTSARSGSSTGSSVVGAAPTPSGSGGTSSGGTATGTAGGTTASSSGSTTATGPEVDTRYGPVQVSVTVVNGQVTDVTALELPSGGRSGQISREAEPILHDEALSAQSASIDGVSGATYTSLAYEQSLQAALDAAGLPA
jgi:uncharacterized protein with FMN-binding domain